MNLLPMLATCSKALRHQSKGVSFPRRRGRREALCWDGFCALFDLAWARIPGSPLRAETDKSVLVAIDPDVVYPDTLPGDVLANTPAESDDGAAEPDDLVPEAADEDDSPKRKKGRSSRKSQPWYRDIALAEWPHFVNEHPWKNAVRGVSDPPEWFSTLADVVHASVYAIDILLADIAAAEEEKKPKTPRPKKPGLATHAHNTQAVPSGLAHVSKVHHRFGEADENLDAATQRELIAITQWTQSKLSRAIQSLFGPRGMAAYKELSAGEAIKGFLSKKEDGTREVEAVGEVSPAHRPHFSKKNV